MTSSSDRLTSCSKLSPLGWAFSSTRKPDGNGLVEDLQNVFLRCVVRQVLYKQTSGISGCKNTAKFHFFFIYQAYITILILTMFYISGSSHLKCYSIKLIITYKRWTHWFAIGLLPTRIANELILDNPPF